MAMTYSGYGHICRLTHRGPWGEPFWTVVDLSVGEDLRDVHQFVTKQEAEDMAEIMNGKLSGELDQP
jgi:hypothetical protein